MEPVILVIHLVFAMGIIILVLLQRSEGGGLGMGGGGLGGFSTARGTANALTKMTAYLAAGFFITSLTLGVLAGGHSIGNQGLLADVNAADVQAPIQDGAAGIQYVPPAEAMKQDVQTNPAPTGEAIDIKVVPEEAAAAKGDTTPVAPVEQPKPVPPVAE